VDAAEAGAFLIRKLALLSVLLACTSDGGGMPEPNPDRSDTSRIETAAVTVAPDLMSAFGDSVHQIYRERPDQVLKQLRPENHPQDVRIAAVLLARSSGEAKLTFAHYLVTQGERSVTALLNLVDVEDEWATQVAAIQVFAKIGNPEAAESVLLRLSAKNDWVRIAAAHALGELGGATPALVEALSDTTDTVVSAALIGLGRSGDVSALPACTSFLAHSNPRVRAAAVSALSRLGSSADTTSLSPLLSDSDNGVRYKAQQAIERLVASGAKESP
jgi:HEAT repeat protein